MFTIPNGKQCYLIALEGADSVGKETQGALLETALCNRGHKATVETIPYRDGVTYPKIYQMLSDGTAKQYPEIFQAFQVANRLSFQKNFLPTLAFHHEVVVLDRWTLSTKVYGKCSGVSYEATEVLLEGAVEPDLTLVFDGEPFSKDNLDAYERDADFQTRVRHTYQAFCEHGEGRIVKIDASRPKYEVHNEVIREALKVLRAE